MLVKMLNFPSVSQLMQKDNRINCNKDINMISISDIYYELLIYK